MAQTTLEGFIHARWKRLRAVMRGQDIDAFLATNAADVSYLSGFSGEDSYLLVGGRGVTLITDSRYIEQARKECPGLRLVERKGPIEDALFNLLDGKRLGIIGIEPAGISLAGYGKLRKALGAKKVVQRPGIIREARMCKDEQEVKAIRRAIRTAEDSLKAVLPGIKPGVSETELAGRLEYEMKARGSAVPGFPTIVAFGARGSMPHAQPCGRRLKAGEAVLIDWGSTVDGYRCDLTRVIFLDRIGEPFRAVYEFVRQAGRAAMAAIRPGVSGREVDAAARTILEQAGYGRYFGHGVGHGIGREVHEAPTISPKSTEVLREGMVFTVEPGIYLPGKGGIRIENDVLVTASGCQMLTKLPDNLEWSLRT